MSGKDHLVGHRVRAISFREKWVRCDCGKKITVQEAMTMEETQEAVKIAFSMHRREMGLAGGVRE